MIVLGIETSAHTIGIGIVENNKILANSKKMFPIKDRGIIPAKVAEFHAQNIHKVIKNALNTANIKITDIDAVSYTKGPGIGSCLRIGQIAAKTISKQFNKQIFPVNHSLAHIEITKTLFNLKDPLVVYLSGGNSQILALKQLPFKHYHIYGETFDIGIGNALDNFARAAKLIPSWGSSVAKIAENGRYIKMPYNVKGMDFNFTGILKYSIELLNKNNISDIAYSFQETMFSMICEASERALFLLNKKELILCGGVAQSKRLQEMMNIISKSHNTKFCVASNEFNADNGAMIAIVGEKMLEQNISYNLNEATIDQKFRIDKCEVKW
ncbi:MAG: tRNA (adenosine(37)-N6)-threonylcarbamoyltransferase complex transferase subunit TsaD [Candidatus Marsarchaeota archaeon]|nr:tRNA (adenosine(37)-N6)-threonylcarbamoyltransferase complex transferase subunit TsaD [Candidatus Marsarchaeota archaeon]MCL5094828.1 tRNA (adenosine(37)-N6)-threonylcarbamoyltransferase complex transferase subunit TsaD [Candidatus Marsarchaeota archaeon]